MIIQQNEEPDIFQRQESNDTEQKLKSSYVSNDFNEAGGGSPQNSVDLKQLQAPQINQIPKVMVNASSYQSIPMSSQFRYQEDQQSQKMKTGPSDQSKITPGYTKYMIEESNQQYDYVRGMFTEDEIKEAFNFLDMNKDGGITSEDLSFFLDFIGEKATSEEIEEMIRMCDKDGSGEVKFEDFKNLAGGWSLPTLGQAHPPTKELVEKRTQINQTMMEKEVQEVARKGKITPDMVEQIRKNELTSPRFGQDEQSKLMFQSINNIASQKKQRQVIGQNLKVIRSEEGQITQQTKQKSSLSQREIMLQRKNNAMRFVREKKIDQAYILDVFEKINKLDIMESCTYEDFIHYLDILDNHQSKLLFNSMNENPVREEYVKSSDNVIVDQIVNLKNTLLTLLGQTNCRKHDKLEIAYLLQDSNQQGYIFLDDLISLLVNLYCISEVGIIEQKILKMTAKKGLKNRKDTIKKDIYISMVNEYGQVFEPI
ncbi:unnamed protein product (macronuclear) [Paramecium tetraurelia]|uniref:EF-hand domain-containing protein n=1 Tax=Paramecium tetraurelia TaxID=5888 RepID=A0BX43_PARTE|nr:uncharacterized protein GSPATT00032962001 [Paramecium tetraurelia]CAK63110.1 unnamed protein product [Paramecium tetraurelia]|eukprot:XP_001430508.1 hypothetical protein (macronuclear) [Paramecium tetraurelia strain d4-2]